MSATSVHVAIHTKTQFLLDRHAAQQVTLAYRFPRRHAVLSRLTTDEKAPNSVDDGHKRTAGRACSVVDGLRIHDVDLRVVIDDGAIVGQARISNMMSA